MLQMALPWLAGEPEVDLKAKHQDDLDLILYCSIRSLQLMNNVFGDKVKSYVDEVEICEATHP